MRNNFKRLEEEEEKRYPGAPPEIESNIQSEIGIFKMIGQIVDMYLPKVVEVFVMITGGNVDRMGQQEENNSHSDESLDRRSSSGTILPPDHNKPSGPGSPDM